MSVPRLAKGAAGGALVLVAPWLATGSGLLTTSDAIVAALFVPVVCGLVLVMGYAGQISLGQNALYGLGAYGSAILTARHGWSPWTAMLASALAAAAVALLVGLPTFRLRGHLLALATAGLGVIGYVIFKAAPITGGVEGLGGVPPLSVLGLSSTDSGQFLAIVWAFALLVLVLSRNLVASRAGRALRAAGASEIAARASGIEPLRWKLLVFVLAAVFASLSGSLYAAYVGFVSPSAFSLSVAIEVVVMAVVGGLRSVWGVPFGAFAVVALNVALDRFIPSLVPSATGDFQVIGFGAVLVLFLNLAPDGASGVATALLRHLHLRRGAERGTA